MDTQALESILTSLNYPFKKFSNYYQIPALYRSGTDITSVVIYPHNDLVKDFVTNEVFSIESLVKRALKLGTDEETQIWLKNKNYTFTKTIVPPIIINKTYPLNILKKLVPIHDYWINRGISVGILKEFCGGVCFKGKMAGRYVFPVINGKNEILGLSGRSLNNKMVPKYLNLGPKTQFKYPLFLNYKLLRNKREVILVEGVPDILTLFELGVRHCVCLFGVEISKELINLFIKYDMNKIIISTNNDSQTNMAGNNAAIKIKNKLLNYFDEGQIEVRLPKSKDLNEQLQKLGAQSIVDLYA